MDRSTQAFSRVPVGQTPTIRPGGDQKPPNVVSEEKQFKSGVLDTDEKFSFTFNAAGTYDYFCSIHPHRTGKVIVK